MLKRAALFALLAMTFVAPACTGPSADDLKNDPNKDAEYKRTHRAEGYRKGQSSQPLEAA